MQQVLHVAQRGHSAEKPITEGDRGQSKSSIKYNSLKCFYITVLPKVSNRTNAVISIALSMATAHFVSS